MQHSHHLDRRSFFARTAAALSGGIVANTVAIIATRPANALPIAPVENPELVELGRQFETCLEELQAAANAKEEAKRLLLELAPSPPDEIMLPKYCEWMSGRREHVVRFGCYEVDRPDSFPRRGRYFAFVDQLRSVRPTYHHRSKPGREIRRMLPVAETYQRGLDDACERSAIMDAYDRCSFARHDAAKLVQALLRTPARASAGLRIKARVVAGAAAAMGDDHFWVEILGAKQMAADILNMTAGGAA